MSSGAPYRIAIATALSGAVLPVTPVPAQPGQVEAVGGSCVNWTFNRQVSGVYDSSFIELANRCPRPVNAWVCMDQVFQSYPGHRSCDPVMGGFSAAAFAPGERKRVSMSARGQAIVQIRECPGGYRPTSTNGSHLLCGR